MQQRRMVPPLSSTPLCSPSEPHETPEIELIPEFPLAIEETTPPEDALLTAIDQLATHGWAELHHFLPPDLVTALRIEQQRLFEEGQGKQAGIGRGEEYQTNEDIRGDWICWWDPSQLSPAQQMVWELLDSYRQILNRECFLSLVEFECHYAQYPAGAYYKRHLDQFQHGARRLISCLLYLNENWQPEDGGALRLFIPSQEETPEPAEQIIEILPKGGTLVTFRSETLEHEVLPTQRTRASIAVWFKTHPSNHFFIPLPSST